MEEIVLMAALAGLLHDIGKFAQRAGEKPGPEFSKEDAGAHGYHALLSQEFLAKHVPAHLKKGLSGVLYHHRLDLHEMEIEAIRKADHLAAGERRTGSEEHADPKDARLIPILSSVSLFETAPGGWKHNLAALNVSDGSVYPQPSGKQKGNYPDLWKTMLADLDIWKKAMGKKWDTQSGEDYLITLSAIFYKYLWCVPSATPWQDSEKEKPYRAWPDVSLYDHCRLTSAIAACFAYDGKTPDEKDALPVALLVRGDFSGIQNFIYRISRPESETEHIAKRLRGRSFYVQLLTEVVVDWILREVGLPSTCAIFIGGGRFDLLLPLLSKDKLSGLSEKLEGWLLKQFRGEIGVLIASEPAAPADFNDMRHLSRALDEQLEALKHRKWQSQMSQPDFFEPSGEQWHVCKICQLTPMDESGICRECSQHEDIGRNLPHARFLAFCYDGVPICDPEKVVKFPDDPFGMQVVLIGEADELKKLLASKCRIVLYAINDTNVFIQPGVACSFRFLANTAPKALKRLNIGQEQALEAGDVLHFEAIAALSKGVKRIGVLRADVDRLGLVMSEGLVDSENPQPLVKTMRPTLSRVASLSRMLDVFFAGMLNQVCQDVSDEWKQSTKNKHAEETDGLFYVMYSGGDDLFIVGPWDQTLKLAQRIQQTFHLFSAQNPGMTISAGYVQVKPRYPVQKFAGLADEAEKLAKKERNQLAAFGETMSWTDFDWLQNQAGRWIESIEANELSSGLIYDLGGLFRQHKDRNGKLRPTWSPQLYYTLARRLKPELRREFEEDIFKVIASGKTLVPVSIASLSIRERSE